MLSSGFGGTSIGATRYLVNAIDPLAIGSFRFGIGFLLLLPIAWLQGPWPARRDWPATAGLGLLFFALFPILFNASLIFTTAARGALALSTLPLLTMLVGAALGSEALTLRKTIGVLIAMGGVALALVVGAQDRAGRCLARRSVDGRRSILHGALRHLVETPHPALRADSLHRDGDGVRRCVSHPGLAVAGQLCACRGLRSASMGRGVLSRRLWGRGHLLSLGLRAGTHHADAGGDFGHGQSDRGIVGRCMAARRAAELESRWPAS